MIVNNEVYDFKTKKTELKTREQSENYLDAYNNTILQIQQKIKRLEELTKDFAQVEAGLQIDDIEERRAEFRTLLNEVRVLQGKEPRQIKESV